MIGANPALAEAWCSVHAEGHSCFGYDAPGFCILYHIRSSRRQRMQLRLAELQILASDDCGACPRPPNH